MAKKPLLLMTLPDRQQLRTEASRPGCHRSEQWSWELDVGSLAPEPRQAVHTLRVALGLGGRPLHLPASEPPVSWSTCSCQIPVGYTAPLSLHFLALPNSPSCPGYGQDRW